MGRRVYWITLRLVAQALKSYIQRNQAGLTANLTGPQMVCVNALLDAVIECLNVLPVNDPADPA